MTGLAQKKDEQTSNPEIKKDDDDEPDDWYHYIQTPIICRTAS